MNSFWKSAAQAAVLALCALVGVQSAAGDSAASPHVTRFDLVSRGMTVGHGQIVRAPVWKDGKPCLETRIVTEVGVNMLLYKYSLKMAEVWVDGRDGLLAYQMESVENGREKKITGSLHEGVFRIEIIEAGEKRSWSAARGDYDLASNAHPDGVLSGSGTATLRVLDPAACTITERVYTGNGPETLSSGAIRTECATYTVECPGFKAKRWVVRDALGPLVLREDGREGRGSYSRRPVGIDPERGAAQ